MNPMSNIEQGGLPLEVGTTPVPTELIDRVMPLLRDTELRVLLVVVRQTLGWQVGKDPHRRKERDWLTQSQLMRRTGRASGAVARAVDVLVRRGLIDVLDETAQPLMTPTERRRCLGRLYYRLHKLESAAISMSDIQVKAKSEHAKAHTTRNTLYKNRGTSKRNVEKPGGNPNTIRNNGWTRVAHIHTEHCSCLPYSEAVQE